MAKIDAHPSLLFQVFVVLWFLMGIAAGDPSDDCNYGGPSIKGHCRHHFLEQNRCHHEKFNTVSEGIPLDLLYQFQLMAQYAAAAYWPGNNNSTDTPLSCSSDQCKYHPEGNCPLVEAANATTSVEFKNTPPWLDDHGKLTAHGNESSVTENSRFHRCRPHPQRRCAGFQGDFSVDTGPTKLAQGHHYMENLF